MIPPYPRPIHLGRHRLPLRQRRVFMTAHLAHIKRQAMCTRNLGAQRRYLPTYLKSVLLHFRASLVHSLSRSSGFSVKQAVKSRC